MDITNLTWTKFALAATAITGALFVAIAGGAKLNEETYSREFSVSPREKLSVTTTIDWFSCTRVAINMDNAGHQTLKRIFVLHKWPTSDFVYSEVHQGVAFDRVGHVDNGKVYVNDQESEESPDGFLINMYKKTKMGCEDPKGIEPLLFEEAPREANAGAAPSRRISARIPQQLPAVSVSPAG